MSSFDVIASFLYQAFIRPALARGDESVVIPVSEVVKGLQGSFGMAEVRQVLTSREFRNSYFLTSLNSEDSRGHFWGDYKFGLQRFGSAGRPSDPDQGSGKAA